MLTGPLPVITPATKTAEHTYGRRFSTAGSTAVLMCTTLQAVPNSSAMNNPTIAFVPWRVLGRGKHDVLLAVVPSTPPLIAITCTTRMALFSLDGTRLPVSVNTNTNGVQSAGDPRPREPQGGDATLAETADATALEGGGVGVGGARLFPQRGSPVAQRTSCFAFGSSTDGDGGDGEGLSQSPDAAAEVHQRDIRCLAASPAGDMIATG